MDVIKLKPEIKNNLWGGTYFKAYNKGVELDKVAECWELSMIPGSESFVASGNDNGKRLVEVLTEKDVGPIQAKFPYFPLLVKLIDAKDNLSVQVHPSDAYALKNENSFGKTEMWHIISSEPGCGIYVGFKKDENLEDVKKSLEDGSILDKLNFFKVKPGDTFMINSGTIHAIGAGVQLIEIQQNSNLTYRLYDYHRKGADGKERELHIEKALKVVDLNKFVKEEISGSLLERTSYFTVSRFDVSERKEVKADKQSFKTITFLSGKGKVNDIDYVQYDTFFIPFGKTATIEGTGVYIESEVEEL